tara:strand:- start:269 stop:436 length:168 start_codon:yes stop_codon:yes gene_type:complete
MDTEQKIVKGRVSDLDNGIKIIAFNLEGYTRNNLEYYGIWNAFVSTYITDGRVIN